MVRAATDLELQALGCDRFLPVVTGFPPSSREAAAEVEDMLDRFRPGEPTDEQKGQRTNAESITWHDVNSVFDLASLWRRARSGKLIMIHR